METLLLTFVLAAAVFYLVYAIRKQMKSHNCDDCGLMEMHKEAKSNNVKNKYPLKSRMK
ncbi:FeoB-associated Cys-rich membrane protein [Vicingaceae bacterium]|nr:FeoB-associated Cys-rich membrane protein [Vicingaceae bacterium]